MKKIVMFFGSDRAFVERIPKAYRNLSDNYMLSAKWSGRPVDWFNFTYELNWDKDKMALKNLLQGHQADRYVWLYQI